MAYWIVLFFWSGGVLVNEDTLIVSLSNCKYNKQAMYMNKVAGRRVIAIQMIHKIIDPGGNKNNRRDATGNEDMSYHQEYCSQP